MSAEHEGSERRPVVAAESAPAQAGEERGTLRRPRLTLPHVGGGSDADRRHQRDDGAGDLERTRYRPECLSAREEFRELAGLVSAASRQRRQDLQTWYPAWCQPRGPRFADGGAGLSSRPERPRRLLSPYPGPQRRRQGGRRHRPQDRRARLPHAEVRPGVRAAEPRSLRASVSVAADEVAGQARGPFGLKTGARNHRDLSKSPARAARPRHCTRPPQTVVRYPRRPRGGGVVDCSPSAVYKTCVNNGRSRALFLGNAVVRRKSARPMDDLEPELDGPLKEDFHARLDTVGGANGRPSRQSAG